MKQKKDLLDCINDGTFDPETQCRPAVDNALKKQIAEQQKAKIQALENELAHHRTVLTNLEETNPKEILQQEAPRIGTFLYDSLKRFERRINQEEKPFPLPWNSVASVVNGGLWPGLYILVGNTGCGKSQWALQTSLHIALSNHPVLYIALELGKDDLVARLLGLQMEQKWSHLWLGSNRELLKKAHAAAPILAEIPYHQAVVPPFGFSYEKLWSLTQAIYQQYKRPPFVVVDFLQLVSSPQHERHEEIRHRVQQTSYAARAIAQEFNAAVLLVSSTSRENYSRLCGDEPVWEKSASLLVGLGKESGEIEYAADGVIVLANEPWDGPTPPREGINVHVGIAKSRAGIAGSWVPLLFNGSTFSEQTQHVEGNFAL